MELKVRVSKESESVARRSCASGTSRHEELRHASARCDSGTTLRDAGTTGARRVAVQVPPVVVQARVGSGRSCYASGTSLAQVRLGVIPGTTRFITSRGTPERLAPGTDRCYSGTVLTIRLNTILGKLPVSILSKAVCLTGHGRWMKLRVRGLKKPAPVVTTPDPKTMCLEAWAHRRAEDGITLTPCRDQSVAWKRIKLGRRLAAVSRGPLCELCESAPDVDMLDVIRPLDDG